MNIRKKLIVIGGDAAGMSAAAKAKRTNQDMEVKVFEKGRFISYAACGIPYYVSGVITDFDSLIARTSEQMAEQGIHVRTRHEVKAIDLTKKQVIVTDLDEGKDFKESYDKLIIATGALPVRLPVPGANAHNVFSIRSIEDGIALKTFILKNRPRRATIIGAGYIGMEMAESFRTLGLEVTVVEMLPYVFSSLDPDMSDLVEKELVKHRVVVRKGLAVQRLEDDEIGFTRFVVTESERWETDMVLIGGGVKANAELARQAGIEIDSTGAIRTDRHMQTSQPSVFAAGDCTSVVHRVSGKRVFVPLGSTANKQGRVAGENAAGGNATFKGIVGTAVAKVFDLEVARTGLNEKEAAESGFAPAAAKISSHDRARYYPGAVPITVKLIGDRRSGRLLGGQIIGESGAAKRIDVVATALQTAMTVEQMTELDLSYAPPYAPVWDPILIAAQALMKEL